MGRQRGSTTVMAIIAMLVLAAASASYAYVAIRNVNISTEYNSSLQAQYSAEAGIKAVYVAGQESLNAANGYKPTSTPMEKSALEDWRELLPQPLTLVLPGTVMGSVQFKVTNGVQADTFNIQAKSITPNGKSRLASNRGVNLLATIPVTPSGSSVTMASLIYAALHPTNPKAPPQTWTDSTSKATWQFPDKLNDPTSPAKSPGSGTRSDWMGANAVLFGDTLGYSTYTATGSLQLVFRVNTFVKLTNVAGSGSGSGYGVYYLSKPTAGGAGDPTSYVVQFDPGLNPTYNNPPGGAWGADFSTKQTDWPYGAFLVKKVWADGKSGWQDEVWDEKGTYINHYAFKDNNELAQRYYKKNKDGTYSIPNLNLNDASTWALQPVSSTPRLTAPTITQVPTIFGPDFTGKYHARPPDLRIAYTLGNLAEGNPWQANTYYPAAAKVAVGASIGTNNTAYYNRMVWVATAAGVSNPTAKPTIMSSVPAAGATVQDGGVTWTAQVVPRPEQVANSILTNDGLSVAKISMAEVKFRVDSVNGTAAQADPYSIPFTMVQGNKNKITIELWADNKGNRIHVIRVNDVLVLGFNDRTGTPHDIIPAGWELNPYADRRGTGIRIWSAAGEFYTTDNYGQTLGSEGGTHYGAWGN